MQFQVTSTPLYRFASYVDLEPQYQMLGASELRHPIISRSAKQRSVDNGRVAIFLHSKSGRYKTTD